MTVFMLCERAVSLAAGNRIELGEGQMAMLEALDYAGLAGSGAQGEAVSCARHFAFARDGVMGAHPWIFARKSAALAELGEAMPGWKRSYAVPHDCLRLLGLISRGKAVPLFELDGSVVSCGYPDAIARYTARVADTALWPPLFADAFCARLASEIASSVAGQPAAGRAFLEQANLSVQEAWRAGEIDPGVRPEMHEYAWDGYSSDLSGGGPG
jgi:hypothetical protein